MKIRIKNLVTEKFLEKEQIKKHKELAKIILLFFALCTISCFLILGYDEAMKREEKSEEYTPTINDTYVYEVFELDLLEYGEKSRDVSEKQVKREVNR